jgi:hypothetical protein
MFVMHSQIFLGGLPVSFEKSEIRFVFQDGIYSNTNFDKFCGNWIDPIHFPGFALNASDSF